MLSHNTYFVTGVQKTWRQNRSNIFNASKWNTFSVSFPVRKRKIKRSVFFQKKSPLSANSRCHKFSKNSQILQQRRNICKAFGDLWKNARKKQYHNKTCRDLLNYEMQKLTVGHQKETIGCIEKDIELLKIQNSKVIDIVHEWQETPKSNNRVDPPLQA